MAEYDNKERDEMLELIAKATLDIETLETRNSDGLDFHDLAVWTLKQALQQAYSAGYNRAGFMAAEEERTA